MGSTERRSSPRQSSGMRGVAILEGGEADLVVNNLSACGALLEFVSPCELQPGEGLRLHFNIDYVGNAIVCRREAGTRLAVRFEERLPDMVVFHKPAFSSIDEDTSGCFVRKDPIGLAECLFFKDGCRWGVPQCGAVLCMHPSAGQFPDLTSDHIGTILKPLGGLREE